MIGQIAALGDEGVEMAVPCGGSDTMKREHGSISPIAAPCPYLTSMKAFWLGMWVGAGVRAQLLGLGCL